MVFIKKINKEIAFAYVMIKASRVVDLQGKIMDTNDKIRCSIKKEYIPLVQKEVKDSKKIIKAAKSIYDISGDSIDEIEKEYKKMSELNLTILIDKIDDFLFPGIFHKIVYE